MLHLLKYKQRYPAVPSLKKGGAGMPVIMVHGQAIKRYSQHPRRYLRLILHQTKLQRLLNSGWISAFLESIDAEKAE
jgi:hypothetical protein